MQPESEKSQLAGGSGKGWKPEQCAAVGKKPTETRKPQNFQLTSLNTFYRNIKDASKLLKLQCQELPALRS